MLPEECLPWIMWWMMLNIQGVAELHHPLRLSEFV